MKLSDLLIQRLPLPDKGSKTYFDDGLTGFGVRVSAGGTKSFTLLHGRTRRRTAIGKYPVLSLQEARGAAKRLLAEETLGRYQPRSIDANSAVEAYLAHKKGSLRQQTHIEYTRILNRYFLPAFKHDRLEKITGRAVLDRLDKLRKTPGEQNHAFAVFRGFFRWCVRNHYLERSPLELMAMPNPERSRDRVLTAGELARVWNAAPDSTFGTIVKLLALTGQRRGEISAIRSEYVNRTDRIITFPPELTKNKTAHSFPYGDIVAQLLPTDREGYLFPAAVPKVREKPTKVFNGWPKAKRALDANSGVTDWVLHDLRRTFATHLAELGVEPHIIEALINHKSGVISGVAATYNRARYVQPMRDAITKWERELQRILATR